MIDRESEPGAWASALEHSVHITVSDYDPEDADE